MSTVLITPVLEYYGVQFVCFMKLTINDSTQKREVAQ